MSQWEKRTIFSDVFPTQKWGNVPILLCLYFLGGWYLFKFTPPHFFPKLRPCFFSFPQKLRPRPFGKKKSSVARNGTLEGRPPAPEVAKAGVGLENWLGILVRRRGWGICHSMGTHGSFIFRGYNNPYIGGLKPLFFMVLGSKGCW